MALDREHQLELSQEEYARLRNCVQKILLLPDAGFEFGEGIRTIQAGSRNVAFYKISHILRDAPGLVQGWVALSLKFEFFDCPECNLIGD